MMKRRITIGLVAAMTAVLLVAGAASALAFTSPTWNLKGTYTIPFMETVGPEVGGPYTYAVEITATSDSTGVVTGTGHYLDAPITVTVAGQVNGWDVELDLTYTDPYTGYNPFVLIGTIDQWGGMSGEASDGQDREFTWMTTAGSVGLYSPRCEYGTYSGYTKVWDGLAPATGDTITTSSLTPGVSYFVEASGTYFAGGNGLFDIQADAEYSQDAIQRAADPNADWTDSVNGYGSYGEKLLDLELDGSLTDWGAYSSDHRYTHTVSADGSPVTINANIYDVYYPNNTGGLCVALFKDSAAPVVSNVAVTPAWPGGNMTITATVDDSTTGGSLIASAEYKIGGGSWMPMNASDGTFDATTENVTASATAPAGGPPTVCVRGTDAAGNVSGPVCANVCYYQAHFLPPLTDGIFNQVQKGQVVPVKITIGGCGSAFLSPLSPAITLLKGDQDPNTDPGDPSLVVPVVSVSNADTSGIMRQVDGQYIYNMQVPSGTTVAKGDKFTIFVRPFGPGTGAIGVVIQIRK